MATQIGLTTGEVIPLGQFTATQDQQGGWTATRQYYMLASTFASSTVASQFARGSSAIVADNTIPAIFDFLVVESRSVQYGEAGTCTVTVNYAGAAGPQYGDDDDTLAEQALPTYRLEGRLMELPLSEHPKWKALSDTFQQALGKMLTGEATVSPDYLTPGYYQNDTFYFIKDSSDNEITFTGNAITFAKLICNGVTTYVVPTITWTETTEGPTGMTAAQLNKLGKISTPRGGPPTPSSTRNWMLTGASQEQRGTLYQTTIEWTLSERDGFSNFLYN